VSTPTTPDFDKLAAERLPCRNAIGCHADEHNNDCPAYRRSAVAAALREMYEQGKVDQAKETAPDLSRKKWGTP
jgi:hypothetical protein